VDGRGRMEFEQRNGPETSAGLGRGEAGIEVSRYVSVV